MKGVTFKITNEKQIFWRDPTLFVLYVFFSLVTSPEQSYSRANATIEYNLSVLIYLVTVRSVRCRYATHVLGKKPGTPELASHNMVFCISFTVDVIFFSLASIFPTSPFSSLISAPKPGAKIP